jgi:hypothetical protein
MFDQFVPAAFIPLILLERDLVATAGAIFDISSIIFLNSNKERFFAVVFMTFYRELILSLTWEISYLLSLCSCAIFIAKNGLILGYECSLELGGVLFRGAGRMRVTAAIIVVFASSHIFLISACFPACDRRWCS